MKKSISLVFLSLFLMGSFLYAGEKCSGMKCDKKMMKKACYQDSLDKLSNKLDLSRDQEKQIAKIMEDGWKEMMKEKESFKSKMEVMKAAKDAEIMKFLNDEQKEEFKDMLDKRKECKKYSKKNCEMKNLDANKK